MPHDGFHHPAQRLGGRGRHGGGSGGRFEERPQAVDRVVVVQHGRLDLSPVDLAQPLGEVHREDRVQSKPLEAPVPRDGCWGEAEKLGQVGTDDLCRPRPRGGPRRACGRRAVVGSVREPVAGLRQREGRERDPSGLPGPAGTPVDLGAGHPRRGQGLVVAGFRAWSPGGDGTPLHAGRRPVQGDRLELREQAPTVAGHDR